jgi:hypothetical protein
LRGVGGNRSLGLHLRHAGQVESPITGINWHSDSRSPIRSVPPHKCLAIAGLNRGWKESAPDPTL